MCTMELGWLDRRSGILVLSFTYSTHVWTVPVPRSGNEHEKAKWMKDIERGDLDPIEILLMFWSDDVTLI